MWKNNNFKTKYTIDNISKIHNSVGVGFGPRFVTHTVGVNACSGPIITKRPPPTPKYVIVNTNYNMDYCSKSYQCT